MREAREPRKRAALTPPHAAPGFYSAESVRVRAALRLQSAVLRAGDDDALREAARLPPDDFRARFALCSLHMWLALVRLRAEGEPGKLLGQAR